MGFNGALTHPQFMCDHLVSFALLQTFQDRHLPRGKLVGRDCPSGFALPGTARGHECSSGARPSTFALPKNASERQAACGHECSSGSDKAHDLDGQLKRCACCRNVTACTALECCGYRIKAVNITQYDYWSNGQDLLDGCEPFFIIVAVCYALMCMIADQVIISFALQTFIACRKRDYFKEVRKVLQGFRNALARERMLINHPY